MRLVQLSRAVFLCMFVGGALAQVALIEKRAFPIERAIQQADIAIGYPNGRPKSIELLRVDYEVDPIKGDRYDGTPLPDQVVRQLAGKSFWVLRYRAYPVAVGGGYTVFLDGLTGEKIYVWRSK